MELILVRVQAVLTFSWQNTLLAAHSQPETEQRRCIVPLLCVSVQRSPKDTWAIQICPFLGLPVAESCYVRRCVRPALREDLILQAELLRSGFMVPTYWSIHMKLLQRSQYSGSLYVILCTFFAFLQMKTTHYQIELVTSSLDCAFWFYIIFSSASQSQSFYHIFSEAALIKGLWILSTTTPNTCFRLCKLAHCNWFKWQMRAQGKGLFDLL